MHRKFKCLGKSPISLNASCQINTKGELLLYGIIGDWWDGLDALTIVRALDSMEGESIIVRIHSDGGNVMEGLAMYNQLKASQKRVVVYIDGIAASMACAVAMAGDEIIIPANALMMVHKPWIPAVGNANDLRDAADELDMIEQSYLQLHADKTGKSIDEIAALIADGKNHFFRGQDAIDYGLADTLAEDIKAVASLNRFSIPKELSAGLFTQQVSKPAAAAAKISQQENVMFKIKPKNGGALSAAAALLIAASLSEIYKDVEAAVTGLQIDGVSAEVLTGKAELDDSVLKALAAATKVDFPEAQSPTETLNKTHIAALGRIAAQAKVESSVLSGWIEQGVSVEDASVQALEAVAKREDAQKPGRSIVRGPNQQDIRPVMVEALLANGRPSSYKHTEASAEFAHLSVLEAAKAVLESAGENVRGKSRDDVIYMAMHTTSDFPMILADVVNKEIVNRYNEAPRHFQRISRQASSVDFKERHALSVGNGTDLEKKNESGEFKRGTLSEAKGSYKLDTYGKEFVFSRESMINDDLGALMDFASGAGTLAARKESDVFWSLFSGTPQYNGQNLFVVARNTQIAGQADLEVALAAMLLAMRLQTGLDEEHLALEPAVLVVSPEREVAARKVITSISPAASSDVNIFANSMDLVIESRLAGVSNNPFYTLANPSSALVFEHCYLRGNEMPYVESEVMFGTRGLKLVIAHDFAAGIVGGRGIVKNPGA